MTGPFARRSAALNRSRDTRATLDMLGCLVGSTALHRVERARRERWKGKPRRIGDDRDVAREATSQLSRPRRSPLANMFAVGLPPPPAQLEENVNER